MELKGMIPNCVKKRQLEEMFFNERKELGNLMGTLTSGDFDSITIEQLNDVMGIFQLSKKQLNEPGAEYFVIEGKYHPEYKDLVADYSEAIRKIKHFRSIKYNLGEY